MGASNDAERVAIAPVITEKGNNIPQGAQALLINKMRQVISLNGLSATDDAPLFIISPEIAVIDEQVTSSVPPMYANQMDVNFVISDRYTGTVFNTINYQLKGAGKTSDLAYMAALKRINVRDGRLKAFVAKGNDAIIEYYNTHCELVISRANSLAAQKNYRDALALLNSTPPVCRECFDKANAAAAEIGKNIPDGYALTPDSESSENDVYPSNSEIHVGDNMYVRFNYAEVIGEQTHVYLLFINKSDDDKDFGLANHWNSLIIDAKGHEYKLQEFYQANERRNYQSKVIIGTPCPIQLVYSKVKEIKFLTFYVGNNAFKFRDLPIKQ